MNNSKDGGFPINENVLPEPLRILLQTGFQINFNLTCYILIALTHNLIIITITLPQLNITHIPFWLKIEGWYLLVACWLLAAWLTFFLCLQTLSLDVCGSECYVQLSSQMNCTNIYNKGWPMGAQYFKPIGGQCILSNQRAVLILLYDWTKSNRNILHSHWLLLL